MSSAVRCWSVLCPLVLLLAWADVAAGADAWRVLLLYSYERDFNPHKAFADLFRLELTRLVPRPVDFVEVALHSARTDPAQPSDFVPEELNTVADDRFDLVIPIGGLVRFQPSGGWAEQSAQIIGWIVVFGLPTVMLVAFVLRMVGRRRAKRSAAGREERFRQLLNDAPVMVWTSGVDKLCTDFNQSWLQFTGRPIEAELGNGWTEGVHPDDLESCLETYTHAFDQREPFQMEYRLRRSDGEYRWILDIGVPRFSDEIFIGYAGSAIDVTDLKLTGAALAGLSRRLMQTYEHDRAGLAKDLHDDVGQRLMGLTLAVHSLSEVPPGEADEMRKRTAALSDQLSELLKEILAVTDQLYARLELLGFAAAATSLCRDWSAQHGLPVEVRCDNVPGDLHRDVAVTLYRVLQEALGNVARHSSARTVSVSLRGTADEIQLEVADDGIGFDPASALKGGGLGLVGIRERLTLVGGRCVIDSRPGSGTRLLACVPLRRRDERAAEAGI